MSRWPSQADFRESMNPSMREAKVNLEHNCDLANTDGHLGTVQLRVSRLTIGFGGLLQRVWAEEGDNKSGKDGEISRDRERGKVLGHWHRSLQTDYGKRTKMERARDI